MEWLSDNAWVAWLIVMIVLGVAELATGGLVLAMLAAGALAGLLTAAVGLPVAVQVVSAAVASVAMLGLVRPALARRERRGPELRIGADRLIGQQGLVTRAITAHEPGLIKIAGETWTAQPYDDSIQIDPGEAVEILQIRGATAYVHPVHRLDP